MPDLTDESVAVMLRMTESLLLAPAGNILKYCMDAIAASVSKVSGATAHTIKAGASATKNAIEGRSHTGQVSMKRLVADAAGAELVSIPLESKDLQEVQQNLKAYGVTFAIMKNPSTGELSAHFKAKSVDQVQAALKHLILQKMQTQQSAKDEQAQEGDKDKQAQKKDSEEQAQNKEQNKDEQAQESDQDKNEQEQEGIEDEGEQTQETLDEGENQEDIEQTQEIEQDILKEAEWMELDNEYLCEIDNLVVAVDEEGLATITSIDDNGEEIEVFSERCPIPVATVAKSFALAQAARFKDKTHEELKKEVESKTPERTSKEVIKHAQERADKRNEEISDKSHDKETERNEPER